VKELYLTVTFPLAGSPSWVKAMLISLDGNRYPSVTINFGCPVGGCPNFVTRIEIFKPSVWQLGRLPRSIANLVLPRMELIVLRLTEADLNWSVRVVKGNLMT
jgi:hypothetical protein